MKLDRKVKNQALYLTKTLIIMMMVMKMISGTKHLRVQTWEKGCQESINKNKN